MSSPVACGIRENVQGRAQGRGPRTRGGYRRLSFESTASTEYPVSGPSRYQEVRGRGRGPRTRGGCRRSLSSEFAASAEVISELEKIRKQRAITNKNKKKLSTESRKTLEQMKRQKEMSRMLLPDAPPSKKKRVNSPQRTTPIMSGQTGSSILLGFATPSTRNSEILPSSGGSLASNIDVPTLSPSYWHRGISVDLEIEACSPCGESLSAQEASIEADLGLMDYASVQVEQIDSQIDEQVEEDEEDAVDMEVDAVGSDEETNNIRPATDLQPAELPDDVAPRVRHLVESVDAANDRTIRDLATADMLTFNWRKDSSIFQGVREKFIGPSGPTFDMDGMQNPLDFFQKIWDTRMLDQIVDETNRYADKTINETDLKRRSRFKTWKPTTREELLRFFSMLMFQSLVPLPVEKDYFKTSGILAVPGIAKIMSYNRFIILKRFLHFADDTNMTDNMTLTEKRLFKIQPLINVLNDKFMTLYLPNQCIAIDESLLHWSGRLSFIQKITNKAAKMGLKSYELCESATGYLWKFFIYGGADKKKDAHQTDGLQTNEQQRDGQHTAEQQTETQQTYGQQTDGQAASNTVEPDGATARIVFDLVTPLLGKGHTVVMDNFYNSPLLARCLKAKGCDVLGTIRLSREFVPDSLKSLSKSEMRVGEVAWSQTEDLVVFVWLDANLVSIISTFHAVEVGMKEKYGKLCYKPQAILDYNVTMGGVDKKDQLLSAYPMERSRNQVWYKKLFRRLLNVSILNAYIMFKTKFPQIPQRSFRIDLAEGLLASLSHTVPVKEVKLLSADNNRPILSGNHFMGKGRSRYAVCVWCKTKNKYQRTVYICKQCNVSLCFEYCFEKYHTK